MSTQQARVRRRAPATVLTLAVVLLLATGVLAVAVVDQSQRPSRSQVLVRALGRATAVGVRTEAPSPTTILEPASSATTLSPGPPATAVLGTRPQATTSTSLPSPPSTAAPTTRPTLTTTTTTPTTTFSVPAAPPYLPPLPTQNGTGTWSNVNNGITTTVHMEPVLPHSGETVHFTITASHQAEWCCLTTFYSGDGPLVPPSLDPHPCPETLPSVFTEQVDHVYSHAGTFVMEVQPSAGNICHGPPVFINTSLWVTIVVAPGR